ncbi:MAG: hypothetical protein F4Z26_06275 [Acidimicrobiaceae bacterium]|nr:hypothetical protein [Acidimicrobiaceae bacterium]
MTATTAQPAAEATHMDHTPDPQPDPAPATAGARSRRWAALGDMLLPTLLATAVVGLLIYSLADERSRIDRLEDTLNTRFAATDAKIDGVGTGLSAKIDEVDDKLHRIDLKLTALIAALNKTTEVEAALEGRLLDSEPAS